VAHTDVGSLLDDWALNDILVPPVLALVSYLLMQFDVYGIRWLPASTTRTYRLGSKLVGHDVSACDGHTGCGQMMKSATSSKHSHSQVVVLDDILHLLDSFEVSKAVAA
jgi:hypothetical protein